ncbi:MAG: 30S ribosomal protein S9, partial [Mycobacterium sp.]
MTELNETETAVEVDVTEDAVEAPEATEEAAVEEAAVVETAAEEAAVEEAAPREPIFIDRPIQTVGRRKEAVVRVRLVPGTGKFTL